MTGSNTSRNSAPIGVFDSGVGGLSVWREIRRQLPQESTLYLADQAHVPYGPRRREEIRQYCESITRFLLEAGCKAIVVACNTASAAALKHLRETFPQRLIIGMEPAVKPAAASTQTGVIGIMATEATFQGRLFLATAGRHAHDRQLINQVCHGLAEHIESGQLDGQATEAMLRRYIQPMLDANADTIVLACTHYPFLLPVIQRVAGHGVNVIDPAPAIARHLAHSLRQQSQLADSELTSRHRLYTTANLARFQSSLSRLIGDLPGELCALQWQGNQLVKAAGSG